MYSLQNLPSKFFGYSCQFLPAKERSRTTTVSKAWHDALTVSKAWRDALLAGEIRERILSRRAQAYTSPLPTSLIRLIPPYLTARENSKFICVNTTMRDAWFWAIENSMKTNEDLSKLLIANLDETRFAHAIEQLQTIVILPRSFNTHLCVAHLFRCQEILIKIVPELIIELDTLGTILLQDFPLATKVKNNIIDYIQNNTDLGYTHLKSLFKILIVLGGISESKKVVKELLESKESKHYFALLSVLNASNEAEHAAILKEECKHLIPPQNEICSIS